MPLMDATEVLISDIDQLDGNYNADLIFSTIIKAYSEPKRQFHVLRHAHIVRNKALQNAERFVGGDQGVPELVWAAWFHDAVYEPGSSFNEVDSLRLMVKLLRGVTGINIGSVANIIWATKVHVSEPGTLTSCLVDADMSILGSSSDVYTNFYVPAIRMENSGISDRQWVDGRTAFLTTTLTKPVYANEVGLEVQAKHNMQTELNALMSA